MAAARIYRHGLRCPRCGSNWLPKDGRSRGKQTYRCGDCCYRFTPGGNRHCCPEAVKEQAIDLYCGGNSVAAISRVLGASWAQCANGSKKALWAMKVRALPARRPRRGPAAAIPL